jgi:hypothetical protein
MCRRNSIVTRLLLLVAILAIVPACSSSAGGMRGDGRGLGARLADRLSYRPVYPEPNPVPRTRPLYLSGYANAQYGRARTVPVYPSTYQVVSSPWLEWWHQPR